MIEIVKHMQTYPNFTEYLLCGAEYLHPITQADKLKRPHKIPLQQLGHNYWKVLDKLCETPSKKSIIDHFVYKEYYTNSMRYYFLPMTLRTLSYIEVIRYLKGKISTLTFDSSVAKSRLTPLDRFILGSGYPHGCSPDDGSVKLGHAKLVLSNEDIVTGRVWLWYNK